MKKTKMNEILELHKKWLNGAADGKRADLHGANLKGAYLHGANLKGADLHGANLKGADLRDAYLHGANLKGADLRGADLQDAYLQDAYLRGADLRDAYLQGADLRVACLRGAKNIPLLPWTSIVPECGSFVGWKKVGAYIIKLKILDDAKRSNATGRKCRCSAAEVLEIQNLDGTKSAIDRIHNNSYCGADYIVGEIVTPDSFDDDRWNECSHGIHFFITRQEAVDY